MHTAELQILGEIMATDVYLCASSSEIAHTEIQQDLANYVQMLRGFEASYSRFLPDNELSKLNFSGECTVSSELFEILDLCQTYYTQTSGLFDPTILPALIAEGYSQSKTKGFNNGEEVVSAPTHKYTFADVLLDKATLTVRKPREVKLDLGGIGKGFIVDKIAKLMSHKYSDFCVDAGGDMFLGGRDQEQKYDYWAINIEPPGTNMLETPTLIVSNLAIATSGVHKRSWIKSGKPRNHIIDPSTGKSVSNTLVSATVIAQKTVQADITAKVLLILGLEKGLKYCENNSIPAVLIDKQGKIFKSKEAEKYVWKN